VKGEGRDWRKILSSQEIYWTPPNARRDEEGAGRRFQRTITKKQKGVTAMAGTTQWEEIANNKSFIELKRKKRNFLFTWWIISTIYYLLLPVISGYFPELFRIKVVGPINFGYVFILSQFVMAIGVAAYYAHVANKDFDRLTKQLLDVLK
jgi:uncharacterized membrane protein (DUF485 family)